MATQSTVYPETNVRHSRRASTDGRSTRHPLEVVAPELKVKLRRMVDTGKNRVSEWKGGLQEGIREKPIQYVLVAAAVGAVIGLLVGRRS